MRFNDTDIEAKCAVRCDNVNTRTTQAFVNWLPVTAVTLLACVLVGCGGGDSNDGVEGGLKSSPSGGTGVTGRTPFDLPSVGLADPSSLRVADETSPYADVLIDCIAPQVEEDLCTLDTLPVIALETTNPTVDDIMKRTVVSHDWMALRFRRVLARLPQELLNLFSATTAVVIAADIRPAYYTTATAAIYLDPQFLWTTVEEKNTISKASDARSAFGEALRFVPLWRYVEGSGYAWEYDSLDGPETRDTGETVLQMAALLFHELAHANDLLPPSMMGTVSSSSTTLEAAEQLEASGVSVGLNNTQPLTSSLWQELGGVLFRGESVTEALQLVSAEQAGLAFEVDGASEPYAYATIYEDTAMLFEEVMMKHHFDIDREVAMTELTDSSDREACNYFAIRWGMRNRVADPLVETRARYVLEEILQRNDVSSYFSKFVGARRLTNNRDWCNVEDLNASPSIQVSPSAVQPMRPDSMPMYW